MSKIEITTIVRDELFEVAEFLHNSWLTEYRDIVSSEFLDTMPLDGRYNKLLKRFDNKVSDFIVMRDAEGLVGVAIFGKSFTDGYADDGEISAMYIRHDCIGKGYGHALFVEAETALSAKGYAHFVLDVLSENKRAVSFYQKHGYEIIDERSIKLGRDEYPLTVFRKKL